MSGQNIKTYYKTAPEKKKEDEILEKQHARVAQNRDIRDEARSPVGKIKRAVNQVKENKTVQKVGGFLKERSIAIADQMDEKKEPKKPGKKGPSRMQQVGGSIRSGTSSVMHEMGGYGSGPSHLPGSDPFGVGGFGSMHRMMGADPFHEFSPRRAPAPQPQRKKKRRRQSAHREPSRGRAPPTGIPSHMKWMFGQ